jgi:hypothetical protein
MSVLRVRGPEIMRRCSSLRLTLAAGAVAIATAAAPGGAQAGPTNVPFLGLYSTSDKIAASPGTPGGAGTFNAGGICSTTVGASNFATGCLAASGPETGGLITLQPAPLLYDTNYTLTFTITDTTSVAGSYYDLLINNAVVFQTPQVTPGGLKATDSAGTFSITLSGGPTPGPLTLALTNVYFDDTAPANLTFFTASTVRLSVSEVSAPEPASFALFGTGLGLIGLMRLRRSQA